MPRKIRQLIQELEKAGFINRGGKGSHRNLIHPRGIAITISGNLGDEAKHYQEKNPDKDLSEFFNYVDKKIKLKEIKKLFDELNEKN